MSDISLKQMAEHAVRRAEMLGGPMDGQRLPVAVKCNRVRFPRLDGTAEEYVRTGETKQLESGILLHYFA